VTQSHVDKGVEDFGDGERRDAGYRDLWRGEQGGQRGTSRDARRDTVSSERVMEQVAGGQVRPANTVPAGTSSTPTANGAQWTEATLAATTDNR
jgi:hypothetical protein